MDDAFVWALIWLTVAAGFLAAEMMVAGSFFLIPFAVGGGSAAVVSFLGAPVWISFPLFLVVSVASFMALRPYAERLDQSTPQVVGVGANRLIGDAGVITKAVEAGVGKRGTAKVGGEDWIAQVASGTAVMEGDSVRVLEVRGTVLIVEPEVSILDAWKS